MDITRRAHSADPRKTVATVSVIAAPFIFVAGAGSVVTTVAIVATVEIEAASVICIA